MASPDDTTILGQWILGFGALAQGEQPDHTWVPTAAEIIAYVPTQAKVGGGWGRELGKFDGSTVVSGRTVDQIIHDVSQAVALIGGDAPSDLFAGACRTTTMYGVAADILARRQNEQGQTTTNTRDYWAERYREERKELKEAIGRYQAGDKPGEQDRQRGAGASSIPVACHPGPASAGW